MTSGERAIFAAEFVRIRAQGVRSAKQAATAAGEGVAALRELADNTTGLHEDARAMLADMLGVRT
jgi:hypothetical protein